MARAVNAEEPVAAAAPSAGEADVSVTPPREPSSRPGRLRGLVHGTLPGCWGAVIFAALSFTPSLLPRGGFIQGLVCGITASIGYGLGVLAAWLWRGFADREARSPKPSSWRVLLIGGGLLLVVAFGMGQYWQHEIRSLMGVTEYNIALVIASPFVAVFFFALFLLIGRGIRRVYRWVAELLSRRFGKRAASATGWVLVAAAVYLVVSGVLLNGLVTAMDEAFSVRNTITEEGVVQPTTALRSGGPGSVVPWDTLGREGRTFAASGPTASEIETVVGQPAMEPIRTYAGLDSAEDAEGRAALAVDDLERAGGFERANLLVITTTGSGWVDPALIAPFEYLTDGDAASVGMQYSYLPSWLSFLVDQSKAREAGRALFDAVYERWSQLPQDQRPRLYVSGESLGTFGGETAFSGEFDLRNRTAGTVFAGPPNFNTLFRDFSDHRDPGSPEIEPVYKNGRTVRFATDVSTAIPPDGPALGRHPSRLPHAPVRPDRLVEPEPHLHRARLDPRAARQGRARGHGLDALHHLLAGHRRPPLLDGGPGRSRAQVHDGVRRQLECRDAAGGRHGRGADGDQDGGRGARLSRRVRSA